MRALILYAVLVIIGTVVAVFVGLFVEREITDAGSVAVFIVLFFANFYVSWVMDDEDDGRGHAPGVMGSGAANRAPRTKKIYAGGPWASLAMKAGLGARRRGV